MNMRTKVSTTRVERARALGGFGCPILGLWLAMMNGPSAVLAVFAILLIGVLVADRLLFSGRPRLLMSPVFGRVRPQRFILKWARRRDVKQSARKMRFRVAIRCDDDPSWDDSLYKTKGAPVGYWALERGERRRVRKELAAYYLRTRTHTGPNGIWLNDWQKKQIDEKKNAFSESDWQQKNAFSESDWQRNGQ